MAKPRRVVFSSPNGERVHLTRAPESHQLERGYTSCGLRIPEDTYTNCTAGSSGGCSTCQTCARISGRQS